VRDGNASQAYRDAYPNQNMNPNSLAVTASRLQAVPKIQLRLEKLRSEARARSGITLDEHMRALGTLRNLASKDRQYGPAVAAEKARGMVSGLYDGVQDEDAPPPRRIVVEIVDGSRR
jgi:hypothetical protein